MTKILPTITQIDAIRDLTQRIPLNDKQIEDAEKCAQRFRFGVSRYYESLIDPKNPNCPILKQILPTSNELDIAPEEQPDPLGEEKDAPVPGLTHRYPDRAMLLVTNRCFAYCRHCNRRRKVGDNTQAVSQNQLDMALTHIKNTPTIRDILISGGDPLTLSDNALESVLASLRQIPHIKVIRIGTRAPVVQPERITPELARMLARYNPLWINTHFNHPKELTSQSKTALAHLADTGIPLGNQTVLLKGINDSPETLKELFYGLVDNRVRPYYLFQCDLAEGLSHFRTSIEEGIDIMRALVGHISSYAVPKYAVDLPDGGGKVPLLPRYELCHEGRHTRYTNWNGEEYTYTAPPADSDAD